MRIAFFTPLSPLQTALADYAEGLLPHLADLAEVEVFVDDGYTPDHPEIQKRLPVHSYRLFEARHAARPFDVLLYNMGDNAAFHGFMLRLLLQHSGVVILNDLIMQHLFLTMLLQRGDVDGYTAEMVYAYGDEGLQAAGRVVAGRGEDVIYRYPLVERILDCSLGVIVQNHHAGAEVMRRRPGIPVQYIPYSFHLPHGLPPDFDGQALRRSLGLSDRLVVGSFGFFIPDKRLELTLRAFGRVLESQPDAVYLMVGGHAPNYDLPGRIREMGLAGKVVLTGWVNTLDFARHMFAVDLAVHLRFPHVGGTPYTPFRLLGLGVPTIVSNIAPLADIPADCCARIDPDNTEEEVLAATLKYLAAHPEARRQMGDNARRYVRAHHDARQAAHDHLAFFARVQAETPPPPPLRPGTVGYDASLLAELGATLAGWDLADADDRWLVPIATALAGLGLTIVPGLPYEVV